jgi:hypothetical protein
MKACGYCGAQIDEAATCCSGCGTAFSTTDGSWNLAQVANWSPRSALGVAVTSGLAALLVATGIYFGVGRACLDICGPPGEAPLFYSHLIWMPPILAAFLSVGAIIFIFAVCTSRCRRRSHGVATGLVTLTIAALLQFGPGVWLLLVPAVLFGGPSNSSVGLYVGAALQLAVGAWLLGWFGKRKICNETPSA